MQDLMDKLAMLRKEVTGNCHQAIIATVMDDYG